MTTTSTSYEKYTYLFSSPMLSLICSYDTQVTLYFQAINDLRLTLYSSSHKSF